MKLTTTTLRDNDVDSIIDQLILLKAEHGKFHVVLDDAQPLLKFTVHVGKNNYEPTLFPWGYVVLGEWA